MRVLLLTVGRPRDPALAVAIREYEGRAARYLRLETIEVRDAPAAWEDERALAQEAEAMLRAVPQGFELVALDPRGETWTSEELARFLGDLAVQGRPGAAFAVGGPRGLHGRLLERATGRWALTRLTLPHEMARLVVAEQIYRAATLLRGVPYHR